MALDQRKVPGTLCNKNLRGYLRVLKPEAMLCIEFGLPNLVAKRIEGEAPARPKAKATQ